MSRGVEEFVMLEKKVRELEKLRAIYTKQIQQYQKALTDKDLQLQKKTKQLMEVRDSCALLNQSNCILKRQISLFEKQKQQILNEFNKLRHYHTSLQAKSQQQQQTIQYLAEENEKLEVQTVKMQKQYQLLGEVVAQLRKDKNELFARIEKHGEELRTAELQKLQLSLNEKSSFLYYDKQNLLDYSNRIETYNIKSRLEKLEDKINIRNELKNNHKKLGQCVSKLEKTSRFDPLEAKILVRQAMQLVQGLIKSSDQANN